MKYKLCVLTSILRDETSFIMLYIKSYWMCVRTKDAHSEKKRKKSAVPTFPVNKVLDNSGKFTNPFSKLYSLKKNS